jgi:Ricin-type beta-trefoil lectin domain
MTRRMVFLCLLIGGAALLMIEATGCIANVNEDPVQIQLGVYTQDCVDVLDASTAPGANLQLYACGAGKLSQEWMIQHLPNSQEVTVENENSKLCMSVASPNDTAPGQYVIQATCNSADPDMQWKIQQAPNGEAGWQFINAASGQCLDDPYGMTDPPDTYHMQQYTCTPDDPGQGWINNPVKLGDTP